MFNLFANINSLHFIYLLYGASFLFLGVSIVTKDMQGSELRLADNLWLLGTFGFLHGAHEWLHLGIFVEGKNLSSEQIFAAKSASTVLLILSFMFLMQFGLSLFHVLDDRRIRWIKVLPVYLLLIWLLYLSTQEFLIDAQFLRYTRIRARYIFAFPGGLLTAYGLIAYSREMKTLSQSVLQQLYYAGIMFIFYAAFEGLFASGFKMPIAAVPIELLRTLVAIFITYFISKALNIFDIEMRNKVIQQARLLVQAEKLSSLGQLAAGIAHEINNPLTNASLGIQTLKQKLKTDETDSEIVEKLNPVEKNIDRASLIAQELLQFSRKRVEEYVLLNINNVIISSLTLLQYKLRNITLIQDLESLPDIMGNPVKLEQVFINILSNAIEAMPEGGELYIASQQNDVMVKVRITDTGNGVPAENQLRVFEPFFTTKDIGSGIGLGLFVSYGIINQHHGSIELSSNPGKGTTVTVKIPTREYYEKDTYRG